MKHARIDYDRFQEPKELLDHVTWLTGFLISGGYVDNDILEEIKKRNNAIFSKYAISQDANPIAEDEPVILFRARDYLAPLVLDQYVMLNKQIGNVEMAETVERHAVRMREYQDEHGHKKPDVPLGLAR